MTPTQEQVEEYANTPMGVLSDRVTEVHETTMWLTALVIDLQNQVRELQAKDSERTKREK